MITAQTLRVSDQSPMTVTEAMRFDVKEKTHLIKVMIKSGGRPINFYNNFSLDSDKI